jgi:hypothetical protein
MRLRFIHFLQKFERLQVVNVKAFNILGDVTLQIGRT